MKARSVAFLSSLNSLQMVYEPGTRKTGFCGGMTDPLPLCAELSAAGQELFTVKVDEVADVIGNAPSLALFFMPVTYTVMPG